jgi:hypothetical protein
MIEANARRPSRQMAARLAEHLAIAPPDRTSFIQSARAELCADRLPPPVAFNRRRSNLPAQPTALIGRALSSRSQETLPRRAHGLKKPYRFAIWRKRCLQDLPRMAGE